MCNTINITNKEYETMQIRPITPINYKNQNVQNSNQQSFGMAVKCADADTKML